MNCAVVIINYNDSGRVVNLAKKLLSFDCFRWIVISDNDSDVSELDKLTVLEGNPYIKILYNHQNLGYPRANNVALEWLKNRKIDYVFSMNADIDLEKSAVTDSIKFLQTHSDFALVSPQMIESGKRKLCYSQFPTIHRYIAECLGLNRLFGIKPKIRENHDDYFTVDCIRSSFWCVNFEYFYAAGFFDENVFLYQGETCVGLRFAALGKKSAILKRSIYLHNHIYRQGYKVRGYKDSYRSLKYIFKKYLHKNKLQLALIVFPFYVGLFLRKIIKI